MNTIENTIPQRSSIEELYNQSKYFTNQWPLQYFADSMLEAVAVLNENQQIVFCNNALISFLDVVNTNDVIGKKPGEALRCIYARESKYGCGGAEACSMCGLYRAIMKSQKGNASKEECTIIRDSDYSAIDLKVRTAPLTIENQLFTICTMTDISAEKRRKTFESVFFHDVLNVLSGLVGYTELLPHATPEEMKEFALTIRDLSLELTEQIEAQHELTKAEHNEYAVQIEGIHSLSLLETVRATYARQAAAQNKQIVIHPNSEDFICASDEHLLKRILRNLTKNALEAISEFDTVTLGCSRKENTVQFWVHNPSVMPKEVQLRIFQRSFSTKGEGRGFGTYSVKLFTERYLKGHVTFSSNIEDGTTFTVTIPATLFEEDTQTLLPLLISANTQ